MKGLAVKGLVRRHPHPQRLRRLDMSRVNPGTALGGLAAVLGFSIPLAAVGIPLDSFALQFTDLATYCYLLVVAAKSNLKVPRDTLKIILYVLLPLLVSWTIVLAVHFSTDSLTFYAYYVLFVLPFVWACALIFANPQQLAGFVHGFVLAATLSALLCVVAYLAGFNDSLQALRNNHSFSLPSQPERASGFLPEASSFAHVLTLGILLLFLGTRRNSDRWIKLPMSPLVAHLALLFMAAALLLTRSTSIFAVLPALALLSLYCEKKLGIRRLTIIALLTLVVSGGLWAYYSLSYVDRGMTAQASASNRFSTLAAVWKWMEVKAPVVGVGLGNNEQIVPYVVAVQYDWGVASANVTGGINSLLFSRIFEEGMVAALSFVGCGLALFAALRAVAKVQGERGVQIRSLALVATWSLLCSLGAGYRGLYYLWLYFPAAVAAYVVLRQIKRPRAWTWTPRQEAMAQ